MNEEKTRKCLRLLEHIRCHLWDPHFVTVDHVLTSLSTAELSRPKAKRKINLYLWYPLSQDQTYNYLVKWYHQYSGTWNQRIDRVIFLSFSLYEVCLIRIKEQVNENRSTVCTHWNPTVCCKTRPSNKANMLSIKNSSMLMLSVA
jgi:hypothetical protein